MDTDALIDALGEEFLGSIPQPSRPMAPFWWVGGKGKLARWIIKFLPRGHVYVEPFAGAASVFWHLPEPYPVEVLNDLDQRIVNLYRVLQDQDKFRELLHRLIWTPYSRAEFARALEILEDPEADEVSRAWAFFVAQNQSISGLGGSGGWARAVSATTRGMAMRASLWRGRLKLLTYWHERLSRVQIDSVDASQAIRYWDTPETVFYVDPPYVHETRRNTSLYRHELTLARHKELVETLLQVKGRVLLSGYDHPVYRPLEEAGWGKITRETVCHVAGKTRKSGILGPGSAKAKVPRTEVLWMNFKQPEGLVLEAPLPDKRRYPRPQRGASMPLRINQLYTGDALELMDELEPSSIDLVLTDPPYFLDKLDNGWDPAEVHRTTKSQVVKYLPAGMKFSPEQGRDLQKWYAVVSEKVYRILKPGGFYLSFSSPRLAHRMAVAVEDAGFHVRDVFIWLYKEGRAKGFSLTHFARKRGEALSKEWKTPQVRGNYEPIIVAQKPPEGTLLDNFLKHGTGLFNFSVRVGKGLAPSNVLQVQEIEGLPPHLFSV